MSALSCRHELLAVVERWSDLGPSAGASRAPKVARALGGVVVTEAEGGAMAICLDLDRTIMGTWWSGGPPS